VEIFAFITSKTKETRIVALKQFRAPVGKYMIELAAGLVDEHEPIATAALRELKEETGYVVRQTVGIIFVIFFCLSACLHLKGKVVDESPCFYLGMAVSSTSSKLITVQVCRICYG
jgi:8-oxo-dGTP pyrophosphatase MutT (NUDIX family)